MSLDFDTLRYGLESSLGTVAAERLTPNLLRISVPNPHLPHESVLVTVEDLGDGSYRLTDAGVLDFTLEDSAELVSALHCAGAPIAFDDGIAVHHVDAAEHLEAAVLGFAHALIAAPTVWGALRCKGAELEVSSVRPVGAAKRMAKRCRAHLGEAVPRARPFLQLETRLRSRDEFATAPLSFATASNHLPRLLTSFIPAEGGIARSEAKKNTNWLWTVAKDLRIAKFVVVEDVGELDHMRSIFDEVDVATVAESDLEELDRAVEEQATFALGQ